MEINPSIFREYDIRGIIDKDLDKEVAELIGKAYGTYIQKVCGKNIVVGCDNRATGEEYKKALIKGLRNAGCDVTDVGIVITPMLYFSVCYYGFDGGINVTGSHNPKEYNGFKLVKRDAVAFYGLEIQEIREIIKSEKFSKGKGKLKKKKNAGSDYIKEIKKKIRLSKKLKVVVDCGNGTASLYAVKLLKGIGCKVIPLYCESDAEFPNHLPDPEVEANVEDLKKAVVENKADIGIAFDGDADRVGLIDEKGERHEADYLLILLARDLAERYEEARVIVDIKSSNNTVKAIKELGFEPILWKSGHSLIKKKMRETNALLGGEVSGHMFFAENYYGFDDGMYAACKLLEYVARQEIKCSELFQGFEKLYATPEIKVPCPDEKKFAVVERIKGHFLLKYPDSLTVDGIRAVIDENSWILIRASNTNPYLTVRMETDSETKLKELKKEVYEKLKEFPEVKIPKELKK